MSFSDPHAICAFCHLDLERRSGLHGFIYLDWRLDPKLDRVACTSRSSPDKKHAPLDTSADVGQVITRRL